jgi:hypothetical protein
MRKNFIVYVLPSSFFVGDFPFSFLCGRFPALLKSVSSSADLQHEVRYEIRGDEITGYGDGKQQARLEDDDDDDDESGKSKSKSKHAAAANNGGSSFTAEGKGSKFKIPLKLPPVAGVANLLWENMPSSLQIKGDADDPVTKKKFQSARKKLRAAFVEYYRALGLLKTFRYVSGSPPCSVCNCVARLRDSIASPDPEH